MVKCLKESVGAVEMFSLYIWRWQWMGEQEKERERDARRNNTFKIASRLTNHKSCKQTKKINNNNAEIFKCWMEEFISPVERGVYGCMQEQKRKRNEINNKQTNKQKTYTNLVIQFYLSANL